MSLPTALRLRLRCKTRDPASGLVQAEGESSDDEDECAAKVNARGSCGQVVWACPREYPADAAERKRQNWLIPADVTKESLGGHVQSYLR